MYWLILNVSTMRGVFSSPLISFTSLRSQEPPKQTITTIMVGKGYSSSSKHQDVVNISWQTMTLMTRATTTITWPNDDVITAPLQKSLSSQTQVSVVIVPAADVTDFVSQPMWAFSCLLPQVRVVTEPPENNKKLIRRWDSERELFTTTSYTHYSP